MVEWRARVESGKETDPEKLGYPILYEGLADEPILSLVGISESPYTWTALEQSFLNEAFEQKQKLKAVKPLAQAEIDALPDEPPQKP